MRTEGRFRWQEWLLLLGFVASITLVGVLVIRSIHMASGLRQEEPIRPWMSVPYIARAYRVPPSVLYAALGIQPQPHDRRPLAAIARSEHRPVQDLIADLHQALAAKVGRAVAR